MNPILTEILRTGYTRLPNGGLEQIQHTSISRQEGEFLQTLIYELKPVVTLEVGLAFGVSALFICDAVKKSPDTRCLLIDPQQYSVWKGAGLKNLRDAGYEEIVEFYELPSYQALPQLEVQGRLIDFAFIDGWHTFDFAMIDFFYIDKMLRPGGVIVFDDADWPSIRKLCRYIVTNRSYIVRCMQPIDRNGLSVKRTILEKFRLVPSISKYLRRILKSELLEPDIELGLQGSCVAFEKQVEATRRWDFHQPF